MTRRIMMTLMAALLSCGLSHGQLLVDFNSTNQDSGPHNDTAGGFSAYDATHEADPGNAGHDQFDTKTYTAFGTNVSLTPSWSNTTDRRVQQMIDRGVGNDANWMDATTDLTASPIPVLGLDFVTDFLGIDTRTGNGGNGNYDGATGDPTYMELTLGGLPANTYTWQSAHIDTENVHIEFGVNLSVDGGATYSALPTGRMVDASDGGNPNSVDSGFQAALSQDSTTAALSGAIYSANFTADGTNDVVLQFAPLSQDAVHRQIFGINGFVLTEAVPEPGSMLLTLFAACGLMGFVRRRR